MAAKIDMIGKRFGRYTVLEEVPGSNSNHKKYKCICDCGTIKEVDGYYLRSGKIRSCGCWSRDRARKHGGSNTRLYSVWKNMRNRCYNVKNEEYENYGGRGIKVCDLWLNDFGAFRDFMLSRGYDEKAPQGKCTIDRIDNNGNYCPENCRIITIQEQAYNKVNNRIVTFNGKEMTLTEAAREAGLTQKIVFSRIAKGWTEERALNTPVTEEHRYYANGKWHTINEWARILGVDSTMVRNRVRDYASMQEVYDFLSQGKVKLGGNRKLLTVGKESHCVKDWACVLGITYHELRKRLKTEFIDDIVREIRKKRVD